MLGPKSRKPGGDGGAEHCATGYPARGAPSESPSTGHGSRRAGAGSPAGVADSGSGASAAKRRWPPVGRARRGQADPIAEAAARGADLAVLPGDPQGWKGRPQADVQFLRRGWLACRGRRRGGTASTSTCTRPTSSTSPPPTTASASRAASCSASTRRPRRRSAPRADRARRARHRRRRPEVGFDNWRKTFERMTPPLPILIENTAGGDNAMARRLDRLARLWRRRSASTATIGFCLDTCHAHAGGEDLVGIVDRVKAITGRIDLVHANDSGTPSTPAPTGTPTSARARSTPRRSWPWCRPPVRRSCARRRAAPRARARTSPAARPPAGLTRSRFA